MRYITPLILIISSTVLNAGTPPAPVVVYDFGSDGATATVTGAGLSASDFNIGSGLSSPDFDSSTSAGSSSGNHFRAGSWGNDPVNDYIEFSLDTLIGTEHLSFSANSFLRFEYRLTASGGTNILIESDTGAGFTTLTDYIVTNDSIWRTATVTLSALSDLSAGQAITFRFSGIDGTSAQNLDVFQVGGLTAVPEPATCAIIFSVLIFTVTVLRRYH